MELRKALNERSREFAACAAAGCAAGAERTPDDALRFQSVLFGLSTVLDKVRAPLLAGRASLGVRGQDF